MLVSFKAASAGLSTVACAAIVVACVEYARKRFVLTTMNKAIHEMYARWVTFWAKPAPLEKESRNENARDLDIKDVRKIVYPYILAMCSAVIIMAACGKVAKSPSLILQFYSLIGAFMSFGAALMFIGIFCIDIEESTANAPDKRNHNIVSTVGLTVLGMVAVSYVFHCGISR
jgi:hypothetical protein